MKFGYSILYVADVSETMAFYEAAFGLQRGFITESKDYGEMQTGDTKLAFGANAFVKTLTTQAFEEASLSKPAPPLEIGLVTQDVDAAYLKAVHAGATAVKQPQTKPWGQRVGYVRDNNGFLVEICSPLG
jgi:lactoylglutathione lyase